ncbi:hypothetical protein D3C85_1190400 [compost metagenome]
MRRDDSGPAGNPVNLTVNHRCQLWFPAIGEGVEVTRTGCPAALAHKATAQTVNQIIKRQHDAVGFFQQPRIILFCPGQFRNGHCWPRNGARQACPFFRSNLLAQFTRLRCRLRVIPQLRRTQRAIVIIKHDEAVPLATDSQTCNTWPPLF